MLRSGIKSFVYASMFAACARAPQQSQTADVQFAEDCAETAEFEIDTDSLRLTNDMPGPMNNMVLTDGRKETFNFSKDLKLSEVPADSGAEKAAQKPQLAVARRPEAPAAVSHSRQVKRDPSSRAPQAEPAKILSCLKPATRHEKRIPPHILAQADAVLKETEKQGSSNSSWEPPKADNFHHARDTRNADQFREHERKEFAAAGTFVPEQAAAHTTRARAPRQQSASQPTEFVREEGVDYGSGGNYGWTLNNKFGGDNYANHTGDTSSRVNTDHPEFRAVATSDALLPGKTLIDPSTLVIERDEPASSNSHSDRANSLLETVRARSEYHNSPGSEEPDSSGPSDEEAWEGHQGEE